MKQGFNPLAVIQTVSELGMQQALVRKRSLTTSFRGTNGENGQCNFTQQRNVDGDRIPIFNGMGQRGWRKGQGAGAIDKLPQLGMNGWENVIGEANFLQQGENVGGDKRNQRTAILSSPGASFFSKTEGCKR